MEHLASFFLIAILVSIGTLLLVSHYNANVNVNLQNPIHLKEEQIGSKSGPISGCNLFSGKWVYDDVSDPPYKEDQCSFMEEEHACEKNRREDLNYQNWRWQPHHCDLPRLISQLNIISVH